ALFPFRRDCVTAPGHRAVGVAPIAAHGVAVVTLLGTRTHAVATARTTYEAGCLPGRGAVRALEHAALLPCGVERFRPGGVDGKRGDEVGQAFIRSVPARSAIRTLEDSGVAAADVV